MLNIPVVPPLKMPAEGGSEKTVEVLTSEASVDGRTMVSDACMLHICTFIWYKWRKEAPRDKNNQHCVHQKTFRFEVLKSKKNY
jgi:hypothetical protein